ncbi:MAG TPA: helix-turn-helix domain-containing protein [Bryobacteraceae bacterium]|nr:helix-turn-helix domain-containing protein [Bryobacteraceae bacterium]
MPTHRVQPDLASLRRNRGVSLGEISHSTKIAVRYLEAIESGQYAKLPGGYYDVSYIRQYAQAVECDEVQLLQQYRDAVQPHPPVAEGTGRAATAAPVPSSSRPVSWLDLRMLFNVSMRMLRKI